MKPRFLFLLILLISWSFAGTLGKSDDGDDQKISLSSVFEEAHEIRSIRSIHIKQSDQLLGERYYDAASPEWPINIKSASKSIISLLVGIAIEQEFIPDVNQPIEPYFQSYFQANPDSLKQQITIKHLLTMQAGLETTSFHNYGRWVISENWVEHILSQPIVKEPGSEMIYSTGSSHLLSVILTKATEMSTRQFANRYLFDPMNIRIGGWDRDPQGYYMGGNNLALKASDMLKIGEMVLAGGTYNGKRIISEEWLEHSFNTYGRSNFNPYDYGYAWWKKPVNGYEMRFAWGYGGQYIFMFPELDSVVVITSSLEHASQARVYKEPIFELLRTKLVPLLEESYTEPSKETSI